MLTFLGSMTTSPALSSLGPIAPSRMRRAFFIVLWVAVGYGTAAAVRQPTSIRGAAAWIAALIFLATFSVAVTRRDAMPLLLVSALAAVGMECAAPGNAAFVAVLSIIVIAGLRLEARTGRGVAALTAAGFFAASAVSGRSPSTGQLISMVPGYVFAYLGATAVRGLRLEQRRTAELLDEAIAGRDARIRAAALDERTRLAREMHDVLAHTLSALSIQLEGTRMLAEQRSSDPAVVNALDRAGRLAREGLADARRAVGSLRDDALPGPDLLPRLAEEFERDTGVACSIQVEGEPVDLSAEARLALYRIAQEALTNVRKHANASMVEITLRYAPSGVELIVENEGTPLESPLEGGSHGLNGMRERAELLEGRLEAGPTPRGFRVWLWIPTAATGPFVS